MASKSRTTYGIDSPLKQVKAAASEAVLNASDTHPKLEQLTPRNDTMLAPHQRPKITIV